MSLAVMAGALTVPRSRAWALSAAGIEQGLKMDAGRKVRVVKGPAGTPKVLGH